ncbi:unnamed protein product [Spirodela intermedia]|uniref:Uncharacterized protein n=1 Tax=Spirodela intermedia TaxID=51605 RepID=A0A7I8JMV7_SPIIN|nr:unnamed protein product [Spirodela intermedia]CAA6671478.1 unnamed protein product [Spirodela intermedia]
MGESPQRSPLPFYKSDVNSGPIQKPGVVPFSWEQRPGQPKDGFVADATPATPAEHPVVSSSLPPPGGASRRSLHEKEEADVDGLDSTIDCASALGSFPVSPNCPVSATAFSMPSSPLYRTSSKSMESSMETPEERTRTTPVSAKARTLEEQLSSRKEKDREEVVFSDAPAMLSSTESCFMKGSMGGLSEEIKSRAPSGRFSTDSQLPDFMAGQFLPTAKATATVSPLFSSTKLSREPPRPVVENERERRRPVVPLSYQHRPDHASIYSPIHPQTGTRNRESDDDDHEDDDRCDEAGQLWMKGCGIFPRLCLKSSFCHLNPLQGRRPGARSTYWVLGLFLDLLNVSVSPLQNSWEEVCRYNMGPAHQPLRQKGSKVSSESNHLWYWSDSQTPDGSSLCCRSNRASSHLPPSPIYGGKYCRSSASYCADDEREWEITRLNHKQSSASAITQLESSDYEACPSVQKVILNNSSDDFLQQMNIYAEDSRQNHVHFPEPLKGGDQGKNDGDLLQPLRLPSESWLFRTLTRVPSKKQPTLRSLFCSPLLPEEEVHGASPADPRLETTVKLPELPKCQMRFADKNEIFNNVHVQDWEEDGESRRTSRERPWRTSPPSLSTVSDGGQPRRPPSLQLHILLRFCSQTPIETILKSSNSLSFSYTGETAKRTLNDSHGGGGAGELTKRS